MDGFVGLCSLPVGKDFHGIACLDCNMLCHPLLIVSADNRTIASGQMVQDMGCLAVHHAASSSATSQVSSFGEGINAATGHWLQIVRSSAAGSQLKSCALVECGRTGKVTCCRARGAF